ncbi:hypothetical protein Tco_1117607, partial [Tanacetum coccineum]
GVTCMSHGQASSGPLSTVSKEQGKEMEANFFYDNENVDSPGGHGDHVDPTHLDAEVGILIAENGISACAVIKLE